MNNFFVDVWQFLTDRRDHPVYRHEMAGWSYLRGWRTARKGCLPVMLVVLVLTTASCGVLSLFSVTDPSEYPMVIFSALIGLLMGGEIIRWLVGLLSTALTATVISAEVEADTLGVLKLTPLTTREIVLAKFSASVRQFRGPVLLVSIVRALFVFGCIALVVGAAIYGFSMAGNNVTFGPFADLSALLATSLVIKWFAAIALVLLALLVMFLYYVLSPYLSNTLFAALGLLSSTLARTRSSSLMAAAGIRVALWIGSYMFGQVFSVGLSLLTIPIVAMASTPLWVDSVVQMDPALLVSLAGILAICWVVLMVALQASVLTGLLYIVVRRTKRLPYG